MATESPIRILEAGGKWPSHKEIATFGQSSGNMAMEELGLLLKGQRFQGHRTKLAPNRSGSAPPSMEGSFAAIENLMFQHNLTSDSSLASLNNTIDSFDSEEQLRADPSYFAYYWSNVNLNPRLPPPLTSSENRHLVRHIGSATGNNWRLTSFDDSGNSSLRLAHTNLSTHKEESEDDKSPKRAPDDYTDRSSGFWSRPEALPGQVKSSVDFVQEDFRRAPSPVYNQSRTFSHESVEEAANSDADSSLHDPSVSASNAITSTASADDMGQSLYSDPPTAPVSSSSSLDGGGDTPLKPPLYRRSSNKPDAHLEVDSSVSGVTDVDVTSMESGIIALNISGIPKLESHKNQRDRQQNRQNNMLQEQVYQQQSNTIQVQGAHSQMIPQGLGHTYIGMNQFHPGPSNFSTEGFTPPLYATAAAYMTAPNAFYPNIQPSGYFPPQYSLGGYAINPTALSPFVAAGYLPSGAVPVSFDATTGQNFGGQTPGAPSPGHTAHGADMQHLNKFYGQLGFPMQPSFADPLHTPHLQQHFGEAFTVSGQFDYSAVRDVAPGSQRKGGEHTAFSDEQKLQHQGIVNHGNLQPRGMGSVSPYYFGSPTNMGILQFPTSGFASPSIPGSPSGGTSFAGGRSEVRFSPGAVRSAGMYPGWQGQGGRISFDDVKAFSFLEELKSGKGRRFELSDIAGHIVEFSADQHGSRFIQQKLENCSAEEKASVFKEVLPHASKLMTDVFGNYVIQKFFEYGSTEQRKELGDQLQGQILPLSLQMYGCRVIQKALDVIELEQKTKLVHELDGHVLRCVRDQNGNHVIQKCIESIPTEKIKFVISSFRGQVATLSMHPYGCRVIQRVLEHSTDELQSQFIVDEILESVCTLAQDQYGNYVTQHVLERGKPHERNQIICKLAGRIVQLSQHKFASNVIEKCLEYGDSSTRDILIGEIVGHGDGNDNLLAMVKDQFANYVVQKILQTCTPNQREMLLGRIRIHLNSLKKYTYGKHIVARFEQLYGEEIQTSES